MKLSELNTGDKAYIIKVQGHGGFRKRIVEMVSVSRFCSVHRYRTLSNIRSWVMR